MLLEEYYETYGGQFSYEFPLINYAKPREVAETPITNDVSENHFNTQLAFVTHEKIGLGGVFPRQPPEHFIISAPNA